MPRSIYQALLCLLLATSLPGFADAKPKHAAAPAKQTQAPAQSSTQSALLFAERRNWDEAALHARKSGNGALQKLIMWMYLQDQESGAKFDDITDFISRNPDWPRQERLSLRAEQAIRSSNVSDARLKKWFAEHPPVSGAGKLALAELSRKEKAPAGLIAQLVKEAWIEGDYDENEERRILFSYTETLNASDHFKRTDRLLWQDKTTAALRMQPLLDENARAWLRARLALASDARDAAELTARVPKQLRDNPGLLHARMMWRARHDEDAGVRDILLEAPASVPFPEKWWRQRELQTRKAIDDRNISLASRLMANHGQTDGPNYADALWLKGWILLEFQNKPQEAYAQFRTMFDAVKFPVSKARAAYWAARAAAETGDAQAAASWYDHALAYPSTFYGQMAAAESRGSAPLRLPADPSITNDARQKFRAREMARIIRLCFEQNRDELATLFANHLIDTAKTPAEAALAADLAQDMHSDMLGVRAAKRALQQGTLLLGAGYPMPKTPPSLSIEPALALAIARQESEFDPRARSRSNALGLMQLLPGTAKETARKLGMPYAESNLFTPAYNMTLGSSYLGRLVGGFDGSYVKAIAAYNAGPRRVREWTGAFGQPGNSPREVINWIEKIPFAETRNYVQRVLENLQVYRHLLAKGKTPVLGIREDLLR